MAVPNTIASSLPLPSSRLTFLNAKNGISMTNINQRNRSNPRQSAAPNRWDTLRGGPSLDEPGDHFLDDVKADK